MRALIFANGDPADGEMVQKVFKEANGATIIAADGGARIAVYFGFDVDVVLGDMDSLSVREIQYLEHHGATFHRYPPEKDETDLEIALKWAADQGFDWIRVVGGTGRRFDQEIANTYLLALPGLATLDVALVAVNQTIHVLRPGTHTIQGQADDTLSLIPLRGDVTEVSTEGLKYALQQETLHFGRARGVSNVMLEETATITLETGLLLMVRTLGKAE